MRRVITPELLDTDTGTPKEVQASLRDVSMINRWFGGTSTTARMVQRVAERTRRSRLSLLDVGSGPGDLIRDVARQLQWRGVQLNYTLLDRAATHLPRNGVHSITGDALALPFRDASFDLVACSLLAHHLEPEQLVRFVDEALRVSRVAVLINDLRRHRLHLALVYTAFPLFRSPLSRHDGVASVRRAYTREEMLELLRRTSARRVEIEERFLYRLGAVVWK